jgi:acid phosphatase (class A)
MPRSKKPHEIGIPAFAEMTKGTSACEPYNNEAKGDPMMVNFRNRGGWRGLLVGMIFAAVLASCASYDAGSRSAAAPGSRPEQLSGYLAPAGTPNSLALLPAPPATGSAAFALDEEISRRSFALRDTSRWVLAIADADLTFPHAAGTFSCALNAPVTEADTPRLYLLLRRSMLDLGRSTATAKDRYQRTRPFVVNQQPMCTPDSKAALEKNGSYPSGHTTIGWGWALILSEISPEHTDAILARGLSLGESRNVCNVHWHSDVVQGRSMAAGTVARLHADAAFRADLEAARAELAAVRNKSLKPTRDCSAEAAALAMQPSMAQ